MSVIESTIEQEQECKPGRHEMIRPDERSLDVFCATCGARRTIAPTSEVADDE